MRDECHSINVIVFKHRFCPPWFRHIYHWGCGDLEEMWTLFVSLIVWSLLTILSCKLATCLTSSIHVFLVCRPLILSSSNHSCTTIKVHGSRLGNPSEMALEPYFVNLQCLGFQATLLAPLHRPSLASCNSPRIVIILGTEFSSCYSLYRFPPSCSYSQGTNL